MRWKRRQKGSGISDTRGSGGAGGASLLAFLPMVFKFAGVKGVIAIAVLALGLFFVKPDLIRSLLNSQTQNSQNIDSKEDKKNVEFIELVKGSNDAIWTKILPSTYSKPRLNLMNDTKGMGPYYMPSTETISIDPKFFNTMSTKLDSPGDFAQAFVISHETAHHIQKLQGLTTFVHNQHGSSGYNQLSVRLELYADFLAGVWAHHAVKMQHFEMEEGDLSEGITAANNIGDDVLQKKAGARKIDPKKFTHGTGAQRRAWLLYGFKSGDPNACKLFHRTSRGISIGQQSLMPPNHKRLIGKFITNLNWHQN